ncbi:AEC family transporter [Marinomonas transparens]|uniref:AEC family transporter n=1 Tax=Marinomonas transparens TaxID=2795388 RepID=A0A934JPX7_9GAMM|nr:AEC family transporter [Marinomonas transparens]MBJ7538513.1 AEC family transporter [Marinomonas transparens]
MNNFLDVLAFSFSITMPIFLILVLGIVLYRIRIINDNFIDVASKLVFNVTLPALLFISISKTNISVNSNFSLVIYAMLAVATTYIALELLMSFCIKNKADRGVIVQGAFRSNMGIIGLAYCVNAYGNEVFSVASMYLGGVTMLFNVLSVICLNRAMEANKSVINTIKGIAKNPLVIAILAALLFSATGLKLPSTLYKAGNYFAQMTLPLALLCAGASLSFGALKKDIIGALLSSVGKLIFIPFTLTLGGYLLGYRGMELGVLFLMSSAPSASASYIMVRAMQGNSALAANIIVITTLASLLSTSIGVTLLRSLSLM